MGLYVAASLAGMLGCGRNGATGVSVDEEFQRLIPADTKALVNVNLDELKVTPLYKRHEQELDFPVLEGAGERFGIDPKRDISDVLVAWNGERALFLARGNFDPAQVEPKLMSLGIPRGAYKNRRVFGDASNSFVFVKKGVAALGSSAEIHSLIDRENSGTGGVPEELQQQLRKAPKGDPVWVVSRGGLAFAEMRMRSDVESALSNIVNFIAGTSAGVAVDTGTHFRIDITCISVQGAQRVRDAIRGGIGLARLTTKDDQLNLLQLYDGINVEQDKDVVRLRADYSGEVTDKLLAEFKQVGMTRP